MPGNLSNVKNQRNQTENSVDVGPKVVETVLPNTESIKGFETAHQVDIVTQIDAFPGELIITNDKNVSQDISTVRDRDQISPTGTVRDKIHSLINSTGQKNNENVNFIKSPTNVTIEKIQPTEISARTFNN